jgi:hypothetical protein
VEENFISESDQLYGSIIDLINDGRFDVALNKMPSLGIDGFQQAKAMRTLARQLSESEDSSKALRFIRRAHELISSFSDPWMQANALGRLGLGLRHNYPEIAAQFFDEARDLALAIPNLGNRLSGALGDLSEMLAEAGRFAEARAMV